MNTNHAKVRARVFNITSWGFFGSFGLACLIQLATYLGIIETYHTRWITYLLIYFFAFPFIYFEWRIFWAYIASGIQARPDNYAYRVIELIIPFVTVFTGALFLKGFWDKSIPLIEIFLRNELSSHVPAGGGANSEWFVSVWLFVCASAVGLLWVHIARIQFQMFILEKKTGDAYSIGMMEQLRKRSPWYLWVLLNLSRVTTLLLVAAVQIWIVNISILRPEYNAFAPLDHTAIAEFIELPLMLMGCMFLSLLFWDVLALGIFWFTRKRPNKPKKVFLAIFKFFGIHVLGFSQSIGLLLSVVLVSGMEPATFWRLFTSPICCFAAIGILVGYGYMLIKLREVKDGIGD